MPEQIQNGLNVTEFFSLLSQANQSSLLWHWIYSTWRLDRVYFRLLVTYQTFETMANMDWSSNLIHIALNFLEYFSCSFSNDDLVNEISKKIRLTSTTNECWWGRISYLWLPLHYLINSLHTSRIDLAFYQEMFFSIHAF